MAKKCNVCGKLTDRGCSNCRKRFCEVCSLKPQFETHVAECSLLVEVKRANEGDEGEAKRVKTEPVIPDQESEEEESSSDELPPQPEVFSSSSSEDEEEEEEEEEEDEDEFDRTIPARNPGSEDWPVNVYNTLLEDKQSFHEQGLDKEETAIRIVKIRPNSYQDPVNYADYIEAVQLNSAMERTWFMTRDMWVIMWKKHPNAIAYLLMRHLIYNIGIYALTKDDHRKRLILGGSQQQVEKLHLQNRINVAFSENLDQPDFVQETNELFQSLRKFNIEVFTEATIRSYLNSKGYIQGETGVHSFFNENTIDSSFIDAFTGVLRSIVNEAMNARSEIRFSQSRFTKSVDFMKEEHGGWVKQRYALPLDPRFYVTSATPIYRSGYTKEGPEFVCELVMKQCKFPGCTNYDYATLPFCPLHLTSVHHVAVLPTSLKDSEGKLFNFLGLFAWDKNLEKDAIVFRPDDEIIPYYGERIDQAERKRRYGNQGPASHAVMCSDGSVVDAARLRGAASNANTSLDGKNNAILVEKLDNTICIVAQRPILNGQEIFIDYREDYVMGNAETVWHGMAYGLRREFGTLKEPTVIQLTPRRKTPKPQ